MKTFVKAVDGIGQDETGLTQEAEEQVLLAAGLVDATGGELDQLLHGVVPAVGQDPTLEVVPDTLHGVQLGGVGRHPLDTQP